MSDQTRPIQWDIIFPRFPTDHLIGAKMARAEWNFSSEVEREMFAQSLEIRDISQLWNL